MMGYYNYMWGGYGGGMMLFAWVGCVLMIVLMILGIMALWKYINQK